MLTDVLEKKLAVSIKKENKKYRKYSQEKAVTQKRTPCVNSAQNVM